MGSERLSKQVFNILRDRIINLAYPPETLLSELTLCEEFGVSRTPLREALKQLSDMNLIQSIPRYGTIVKPINVHEIRNACEVRVHLEYLAGFLAAQRMPDHQLTELKAMLDAYEQSHRQGEDGTEKDVGFHEIIYEATQNSVLETTLKRLTSQCLRFCLLMIPQHLDTARSIVELKEIYRAIESKDAELSGRLCRQHAQYYFERIREAVI